MGITIGENPVVDVITKKFGNLEVDIWKVRNKSLVNGPPVVMIHGMFGKSWYFEDWARCLREKGLLACVIKDLHEGENLRKVDFYTYVEKTIKVVEEICNETDSKIVPLGHSMGGLIAQKIAETKPDLVAGLVLVASAPPKGISTMSWSVAKAMAKHFLAISFNLPLKIDRKSAFELILNWTGKDEYKEYFFKKFVPESSIVAKQLAFSRIPVDESRINCKSLVVAGFYDKLLPFKTQANIAQKYNSDYREFQCGHMPMIEYRWRIVISEIYDWINLNFIC